MRSIAYSFHQAGQDEILEPYTARYLAAAESIWEERSVHHASTVLSYLFPRTIATQDTLDQVDQWLAGANANPAGRRYVLEGRSDLERALAAQRKDASA
jgi:aminopeptidase N